MLGTKNIQIITQENKGEKPKAMGIIEVRIYK